MNERREPSSAVRKAGRRWYRSRTPSLRCSKRSREGLHRRPGGRMSPAPCWNIKDGLWLFSIGPQGDRRGRIVSGLRSALEAQSQSLGGTQSKVHLRISEPAWIAMRDIRANGNEASPRYIVVANYALSPKSRWSCVYQPKMSSFIRAMLRIPRNSSRGPNGNLYPMLQSPAAERRYNDHGGNRRGQGD
jgi:hypothetical protein